MPADRSFCIPACFPRKNPAILRGAWKASSVKLTKKVTLYKALVYEVLGSKTAPAIDKLALYISVFAYQLMAT